MNGKANQRKLTDDQVRQIRIEYIHGKGAEAVAKILELSQRYSISQQAVRQVAKSRSYDWVK
jgi:hypothetical protein